MPIRRSPRGLLHVQAAVHPGRASHSPIGESWRSGRRSTTACRCATRRAASAAGRTSPTGSLSRSPVVPLASSHGTWARPMYWATRPGGANSLAYSRNRADHNASPIENNTKYHSNSRRSGPKAQQKRRHGRDQRADDHHRVHVEPPRQHRRHRHAEEDDQWVDPVHQPFHACRPLPADTPAGCTPASSATGGRTTCAPAAA